MAELTKEQFIERFVAHMLKRAGRSHFDPDEDGTPGGPIEPYARETAETYWEDESQREDGPEGCAESDMEIWWD